MAVLPVILFHAGFAAVPGGFVGVDVFFVISGYLITGILIEEITRGQYSILRFYERRARRILPALVAVLLACIPFAWMWLLPEQLKDFGESLAAVLVFLSNLYFMSQVSYFAPAAELQPLLHTWSLAVEEQYYLIFPLIVAVSLRFGLRTLFAVTLTLTLSSLFFSEVGLRINPERNFFFSLSRFWELGVGSLCAVAAARCGGMRNGPLAGLGLLLILAAVFLYDRTMPFAGLSALLPVGGAALILLFCREDTLTGRLLSQPIMVGVGLISYSAYLVHQPLFAFARIRSAEEPGAVLLVALCLASLGLGWLSWRFIERPFRGTRPSALPDRRHFAAAAAAAAAVLMMSAVAVRVADGFPGRVAERFQGEIGRHGLSRGGGTRFYPCTSDVVRDDAETFEDTPACFQSRPDLPITIALVGDSHAGHLFSAVADFALQDVVGVYVRSEVPFGSSPGSQGIYAELAENTSLTTVIYTMHWPRRFIQFDDEVGFRAELRATLAAFKSLGVTVLVVGDLPWFASEPASCKYEVFEGNLRYCTAQRADAADLRQRYGPILAEVTAEIGIPLIPIRNLFCDDRECSMVRDGVIQFFDSNHLNASGARTVGGRLSESLLAQRLKAAAP